MSMPDTIHVALGTIKSSGS